MSNTPVTATVSEPVREKRPTLYGVLYPSELENAQRGGAARIRFWTDPEKSQAEQPVPGSTPITIPGECDDAPSGWRPASEVTALQTICMACVELSGHDLSERAREILQEISNAARSIPLPTPPGAKP